MSCRVSKRLRRKVGHDYMSFLFQPLGYPWITIHPEVLAALAHLYMIKSPLDDEHILCDFNSIILGKEPR